MSNEVRIVAFPCYGCVDSSEPRVSDGFYILQQLNLSTGRSTQRVVGFAKRSELPRLEASGKVSVSTSTTICPECAVTVWQVSSLEELAKMHPTWSQKVALYIRYKQRYGS